MNSPLVTRDWPADGSNYTPGRPIYGGVWGIVIHHAASTSLDSVGQVFSTPGRGGSAHYGVCGNQVDQYVNENDTAWHCGDWNANCGTIGIETINSTGAPDWLIADDTFDKLCELVADIARRQGLGRLKFEPDGVCPNLSAHRDWAATYCLPMNTELLTPNGWKQLADIELGEDIATAHIDDLSITFSPVENIVEPKMQSTWTQNGLEATADHRVIYTTQKNPLNNRVAEWSELFNGSMYYIPNAGHYEGKGLPLSDREIKLLVAVQADGHYEHGEKSGKDRITFHFAKERKIERLKELLDGYDYSVYNHADGTVNFNIKGLKPLCEEWLDDKKFSWKFLEMSPSQAEVFLSELLLWDGCISGNFYCSTEKQNIDVVTAVAALNNVGTHLSGDTRLYFSGNRRSIDSRAVTKRSHKKEVSCVTVRSGFILIRQHGMTTIVGNCPGDYLYSKMYELQDRVNEINYPTPKPEPTPPKVEWVDVTPATAKLPQLGADLVDVTNGNVIKKLYGTFDYVQKTKDGKYARTEYSKQHSVNNGVAVSDFVVPSPNWVDIQPDTYVAKDGLDKETLYNILDGTVSTTYPANTKVDLVQKTDWNGITWLRTENSKDNNIDKGFKMDEMQVYTEPAPEPEPTPEPTPEPEPTPDPEDYGWVRKLLKTIADAVYNFFKNLFGK